MKHIHTYTHQYVVFGVSYYILNVNNVKDGASELKINLPSFVTYLI